MPVNKNQNGDYNSLSSSKKNDEQASRDLKTLKPADRQKKDSVKSPVQEEKNLVNFVRDQKQKTSARQSEKLPLTGKVSDDFSLKPKKTGNGEITEIPADGPKPPAEPFSERLEEVVSEEKSYSEKIRLERLEKRAERDFEILKNENWVIRNGHFLTYLGLYSFSVLVFFRPYELIPGLGFLAATAFYFAAATLFVFLPTQLATEGNLTVLSTEVKCILVITGLAILTMPIAKSPGMAWEEFNDSFSKAVLMFIVMVNVLRTRRRLMGIIWLALAMGFVLSYMALNMYMRGEISVEGYRVAVDIGGMFGNPNELALHLVIMTPIAVALGLAAKNPLMKYLYYITAGLFVAANVVTYSRGGFLGLLALSAVLIWKFGKQQRVKILLVSGLFFVLFIILAPGEYGQRIFSIFDSSLDSVGSSNQRTELLKRSIIVTLRNPWGIGIGNFPIVGLQNLGTHNAYTQISSEIGIVSLAAYLIFLISPFRKLGAIERRLLAESETNWFYYLAIGLQASIVGFMVSSFFAAVAYNWFVYYLIAYAVAFRRIYTIETGLAEEDIKADSLTKNIFSIRRLKSD